MSAINEILRFADVVADIVKERTRQNLRWGEQNHPSIKTGMENVPNFVAAQYYGIPTEESAKERYEQRVESGIMSWPDVLIEEVAEVVNAFASGDAESGRAELVQCAAVIMQWIECIDRNKDSQ